MSQPASTAIEILQVTLNGAPLPDGWRCMKLGEVCTRLSNGTSTTQNTEGKGLPVTRIETISSGKINVQKVGWIDSGVEDLERYILRAGDILFSHINSVERLGNCALYDGTPSTLVHGMNLLRIELNKELVEPFYLLSFFKSEQARKFYDANARRAIGQASLNTKDLSKLEIPCPPLSEQQRIASILIEHMAAVERARAAAEAQLKAAKDLPVSYLRAVFESETAQKWTRKRLDEIGELLPSKSIATNGDTQVLAITTACLDEIGFQPTGVKTARMWAWDVEQCEVSKGEVLIARSNTAELVGRSAMFLGEPQGAVASDLTIRYMPHSDTFSPFLAAYLSFLYATGYWKERAGGASGSMKKITRPQVLQLTVPVPNISEQNRITELLNKQMQTAKQVQRYLRDQFDSVIKLPAALLRQAFTGKL